MWLVSQEYQGQAEVDRGLLESRHLCLGFDGCLSLHENPDEALALVVAAVCLRLGAFSFRMKVVGG